MDMQDLAAWLNERLDKLETKVDGVNEHCANIDLTLEKNTADMKHHIKRTDLAEARIEQIRDYVAKLKGAIALLVVLLGLAEAFWHFWPQ